MPCLFLLHCLDSLFYLSFFQDKIGREKITWRSANYVVIGDDLYRKAVCIGVLMKCIL
jgi:hypothetical protein